MTARRREERTAWGWPPSTGTGSARTAGAPGSPSRPPPPAAFQKHSWQDTRGCSRGDSGGGVGGPRTARGRRAGAGLRRGGLWEMQFRRARGGRGACAEGSGGAVAARVPLLGPRSAACDPAAGAETPEAALRPRGGRNPPFHCSMDVTFSPGVQAAQGNKGKREGRWM
ncbi:uncharacterized protein LOC144615064 [Panthera onca]